jgi:hypothetical protein
MSSLQKPKLFHSSMGKVHQRHRKVRTTTLVEGLERPFTENRHKATFLANKLGSYSRRRGDRLTRLQKLALLRFHDDQVYDLRDHVEYSDDEVLRAYVDLFDELFFFATLRSCCVFRFVHKREEGKFGAVEDEYKLVLQDQLPIRERRCKVILYNRLPEENTRYKRLKGYMGTLLHEMIHAFFRLWACDDDECTYTWDRIGKRGSEHGEVWQDVACALEKAVRDDKLLNLDLTLNRAAALALELFVGGRKQASRADYDGWNLSKAEVKCQLDHIKRVGYRKLQS